MDHALRTISYIADIGELVVLMARRREGPAADGLSHLQAQPKMICHVFESDEVSRRRTPAAQQLDSKRTIQCRPGY